MTTPQPLNISRGFFGVGIISTSKAVPLPPLNNFTLPIGTVTSSRVFPASLALASSFAGVPGAIPRARYALQVLVGYTTHLLGKIL